MYGVVVAHAYAPVYGACEGSPVSGAHDVVYAHVESAPVVRYARPVASVGVAVDEPLRERVVAVGYGAVVEVAAEYDALPFVPVEKPRHGIGLWRTPRGGGHELGEYGARLCACRVALHVAAHHGLEAAAVLGR